MQGDGKSHIPQVPEHTDGVGWLEAVPSAMSSPWPRLAAEMLWGKKGPC